MDARIVHEPIDSAEPLERALNDSRAVLLGPHAAGHAQGAAGSMQAFAFQNESVDGFLRTAERNDPVPGYQQRKRHRLAETGRRSRYDDDPRVAQRSSGMTSVASSMLFPSGSLMYMWRRPGKVACPSAVQS